MHITSCRNHHGKGFLDFGFLINMLSDWKQTNIGDTNSTCLLKQRKPRCHVCSKIARLLACFNRRLHFGDGKNFRYHFVTTNRCEQCLATKLRENVHYHNGYLNEWIGHFPPMEYMMCLCPWVDSNLTQVLHRLDRLRQHVPTNIFVAPIQIKMPKNVSRVFA